MHYSTFMLLMSSGATCLQCEKRVTKFTGGHFRARRILIVLLRCFDYFSLI